MDTVIEFIGDNYAWFLTITILLLFALIGYIYDSKRNKSDLVKRSENELEEQSLENIKINEEKSLANMIVNSKNINPETKTVELVDPNILKEEKLANAGVNVNNGEISNNNQIENLNAPENLVNANIETLGAINTQESMENNLTNNSEVLNVNNNSNQS